MTDGATPLVDPAPTAATATEFVTTEGRSEVVELEWPVKVGDVVYERVTIRRLTVADIAAYAEKVRHAEKFGLDKDAIQLPMFDIPDSVFNALDDDDGQRLLDVASRFLPRRFRADAASAPE